MYVKSENRENRIKICVNNIHWNIEYRDVFHSSGDNSNLKNSREVLDP